MAGLIGSSAPASWADVLTLIGAGLKDASPYSQGGNLLGAQQYLMQRNAFQRQQQLLAGLPSLFGGQAAQTQQPQAPVMIDPGSGPTMKGPGADGEPIGPAERAPVYAAAPPVASVASGPDFNRIAAAAPIYKAMGIDLAPSIEALKAAQPDLMVTPSGEAINKKSSAYEGKVFPTVDKNQIVLRDARGNPMGVINLPGAVSAAADAAGAVANAQEAAKAGYNLVDVPMSNGATVKMPAAIAAPLLAARAAQMAGGAISPTATAAGAPDANAQFGVTQTPAEQELAKARATTQGKREELLPKETAALADLDNRSKLTSQIIHQILGDAPVLDKDGNPTGQYRQGGAKGMIGPLTTGVLGGNLTHIWQPAHDLEAQIDHIRAMTSLDELQKLRDNSPTGAGLGRVTQQEIDLLAAMRGSVDQAQSGAQLQQNLRRQLNQLDQIRANRLREYQQTYGGIQAPTPGQTAPIPPGQSGRAAAPLSSVPMADRIAEARRRGLIK